MWACPDNPPHCPHSPPLHPLSLQVSMRSPTLIVCCTLTAPGETEGRRVSQQVPCGEGPFLLESHPVGLAQHQLCEGRGKLGQAFISRTP